MGEEREPNKRQYTNRLKFIDISLKKRSYSIDYNNIAFCNKYHFGLGLEITNKIKRRKGLYYHYLP